MKNNPFVSIIIPVYNGESYLVETIKSVLNQTYKTFEIIIVDDGSTDGSAAIIKNFSVPIRYFFQSNSGTAAARNFGIDKAKGSFFTFLDQDDLWLEDKLSLQISAFKNDSKLDIVFGQIKQFYSPEVDELFRQSNRCSSSLMPGYLPSAMLIKREAFFNVGLFESNWQIGEWANWFIRASEQKLKMMMLPELVAMRRIHAANKGVLQRKSITEYVHILKASLDRRRTSRYEEASQTKIVSMDEDNS